MPEGPLLGMIRTGWVARGRPYAAILFLDEIGVAKAFLTAVAPLFTNALVQAFGEGFGQAVGDGFRHDRVVVVVLRAVIVAEFLQADASGDCKRSDVVLQAGFFGGDEVDQRAAGFAAFAVRLLAEEMKTVLHLGP